MRRFPHPLRDQGPHPVTARAGRRMPLRHKLMLLLAVEILAVGFRQAEANRQHKGILVETPAHAGNAIA